VIAYLDTSALIPLMIDEPSSAICQQLWNSATRVVSARLLYPEARAALARAERTQRLTRRQHTAAIADLDSIIDEVDHIELTAALAHVAGDLAQRYALRGYDAVHLAAAAAVADDDVVLATGDADLATATNAIGISVALTAT
jgi:predicted nucleic acid-binding protein